MIVPPQFLYTIYEKRLLKELDPDRMPRHVAIIMDGNRRYSRIQGNMEVIKGHEVGVDTLEKVLDWSIDLGIEIVTAYAFSTENFNRPQDEVEGLMNLFVKNFKRIVSHEKIHKNKVRVKVVGRTELLPDSVREAIMEAEEATKDYDEIEGTWGDTIYEPQGIAQIECDIVSALGAFDNPSLYTIENVKILDGVDYPLKEVVSFTHTYAGEVIDGEHVIAKGKVEKVITQGKDDYYRLVVGTTREAIDEYLKLKESPA